MKGVDQEGAGVRYAVDRVLPPITQNERMATTRPIESTNKQTGSNDTASFDYRGDSERSTKGGASNVGERRDPGCCLDGLAC